VEAALTKLIDKDAIRQIQEDYCRGNDRHDVAMVETCFWPDAEAEYGLWRGRARELPAFASATLKASYVNTSHMIGQSRIRVSGNAAVSETYCFASHFLADTADGGTAADLFWCRYIDRLEKRDGVWGIAFRHMVVDQIQQAVAVDRGAMDFSQYAHGRQGRDDPSYKLFDD
jgi:hypothetical protein